MKKSNIKTYAIAAIALNVLAMGLFLSDVFIEVKENRFWLWLVATIIACGSSYLAFYHYDKSEPETKGGRTVIKWIIVGGVSLFFAWHLKDN